MELIPAERGSCVRVRPVVALIGDAGIGEDFGPGKADTILPLRNGVAVVAPVGARGGRQAGRRTWYVCGVADMGRSRIARRSRRGILKFPRPEVLRVIGTLLARHIVVV